jgi:hypothetical protein
MAPRLSLNAKVFLGGEWEFDQDDGTVSSLDLLPTYAVSIRFDLPLHRWLTLGLELQSAFWIVDIESDAGRGRSIVIDALLRPAVRYPIVFDSSVLELHGAVPFGPNLSILNDDSFESGLQYNSGVGFSIGFALGVEYWMSQALAVTAEFGFLRRSLSNAVEEDAGGELHLDTSISQWGLSAGISLAL